MKARGRLAGSVALVVLLVAACTESPPATSSGTGGDSSSTGSSGPGTGSGAGATRGIGATSGSSSSGSTTGAPVPVVIYGQIPGVDFSPQGVLSLELPPSPSEGTALLLLISDLPEACEVFGSKDGGTSLTLLLTIGVPAPDGGFAAPTAPGTFGVVDETSSSGPPVGPFGEIVFEDQVDGGCSAWICTGGSIQLTSVDPVEGSFNVTLEAPSGDSSQASLSGSFTATACPGANLDKLSCSSD